MKKIIVGTLIATFLATNSSLAFASEIKNKDNSELNHVNAVSNPVKKSTLTKVEKNQLNNWLKDNDVDENVRNALLDKLENGVLWDSVTSTKPVEKIKLSDYETKEVFADGSVKITTIETNRRTTRSVSGGTSQSGTGYTNVKGAKVFYSTGVVTAWFFADYTFVNGGYDYISRVYKHKVAGVGCSVSNTSLKLEADKKVENADTPAEATLSFEVTAYDGLGGASCYLNLYVGNDSATDEASF